MRCRCLSFTSLISPLTQTLIEKHSHDAHARAPPPNVSRLFTPFTYHVHHHPLHRISSIIQLTFYPIQLSPTLTFIHGTSLITFTNTPPINMQKLAFSDRHCRRHALAKSNLVASAQRFHGSYIYQAPSRLFCLGEFTYSPPPLVTPTSDARSVQSSSSKLPRSDGLQNLVRPLPPSPSFSSSSFYTTLTPLQSTSPTLNPTSLLTPLLAPLTLLLALSFSTIKPFLVFAWMCFFRPIGEKEGSQKRRLDSVRVFIPITKFINHSFSKVL